MFRGKIQRENKYILPYKHISQVAENEMKSRLSAAFNFWLDVPTDKLNEILELAWSAIDAVILIDDIADNATVRGEIPAAHTIFGVGNTITCANLIQFDVLQAAEHLGHPDAVKIIVKNLADIYQGQAMELYWIENAYTPTEEEYETCLLYKAGGLLWIPVKLMELFSKQKYDFDPLMKSLIKYFQIRDDYNDIQGSDTNSTSNDDISAGAYSYPIIHALRNNPDDVQIRRILQLRTQDNRVRKYFMSLLEKCGSLEHTRNVVNKLEQEVRDEIEKLGGNPVLSEAMDYFTLLGVSTK